MSYTPFMIAGFREGEDKSLEPWLTPDQAFTTLENVYIDRGILKKRGGVSEYGQLGTYVNDEHVGTLGSKTYTGTLANTTPISGSVVFYDAGGATQTITDDGDGTLSGDGTGTIIYATGVYSVTFTANTVSDPDVDYHYSDTGTDRIVRGVFRFDKDLGGDELLALDKRRLSRWNTSYEYFENIPSGTAIADEAYDTGAGGSTYTHTASNIPVIPFTVSVGDAVTGQVLYDNGYGVFIDSVGGSGTGTINYTTGEMSVTFETVIAANPILVSYHHAATKVWDTFNSANLIWGKAWQDLYWFCDNSSNIHVYNGTYVIDITPRLALGLARTELLTSAKCMEILNERPVFFNTVEDGTRYSRRARWSSPFNTLTVDGMRDDIDGQGDYLDATTNDEIVTTVPLRDRVVVFFENTIGLFSYTGNSDAPYRWDMLNNEIKTSSTFGTWNFKQLAFALGKFEITACDGVTAQKANVKIPEFTMNIDYSHIDKCYGHVIPEKRQAWLAYPSRESGLGYPDKVMVFNYDDNVVSEYSFLDSAQAPLDIRCLEAFDRDTDATYADLASGKYWEGISAPATYADYVGYSYEDVIHQSGGLITLAGSKDGYVYIADDESSLNDNGSDYNFKIDTKKFNPYIEQGRNVSLGHVDFLVSAVEDCEVEVKFYLGFTDNETGTLSKTFSCSSQDDKVIKRVYCNASANVIGYRVSHPESSESKKYNFELHSHTPYFKVSGKTI